eukprot:TRINITY_DN6439_c0_g1_i1.p2 TRINITY_DN6439_c0_g1~~TRINITY_DN6439_c0_g1_i1.p2  ORF type:complete len:131 (+),score=14.24 TRINITY_DN6439_c0_g1_i1:179-571(+)
MCIRDSYCPRARTGLFNLYNNQPNVVPLIWQGDSANASPGYSQRRGLVGSLSQGIPQGAFQGLYLEVGAAVDAYTSQYLPRYNQIINTNAPMTVNATILGSNGEYTLNTCLLYTSPSPRDLSTSRMPSSA